MAHQITDSFATHTLFSKPPGCTPNNSTWYAIAPSGMSYAWDGALLNDAFQESSHYVALIDHFWHLIDQLHLVGLDLMILCLSRLNNAQTLSLFSLLSSFFSTVTSICKFIIQKSRVNLNPKKPESLKVQLINQDDPYIQGKLVPFILTLVSRLSIIILHHTIQNIQPVGVSKVIPTETNAKKKKSRAQAIKREGMAVSALIATMETFENSLASLTTHLGLDTIKSHLRLRYSLGMRIKFDIDENVAYSQLGQQ